jgi:hypothetical protein
VRRHPDLDGTHARIVSGVRHFDIWQRGRPTGWSSGKCRDEAASLPAGTTLVGIRLQGSYGDF